MNNRNRLGLAMVVALATLVVVPGNKLGRANAQTRPKPIIIFAVSGDPGELNMDAVVAVSGKRLRAPYSDEQKDRQKAFAEEYFPLNREYRLTFGGGQAGSVKVSTWSEGCNNVHAKVTIDSQAPVGGHVYALATNSETLGTRPSARRAPTDVERAGVMELVKRIYAQHGVSAAQVRALQVTNLTATDLEGDGKYEMIGSFTLAAKNKFERDLFLIAKSQGAGFRADFVKFQAYQPPPEEFLSSINFVDQLDLDGNGTGEVFATQGGFDAYGYLIFKKVGGRWREVYQGFGDAC